MSLTRGVGTNAARRAMKSHLHGGAGFHLWARVSPGGRIVNMIRDSTSFTADVDGELQLGIYLGMWGDAFGRLDTPAASIFAAIAHRMGTHARTHASVCMPRMSRAYYANRSIFRSRQTRI